MKSLTPSLATTLGLLPLFVPQFVAAADTPVPVPAAPVAAPGTTSDAPPDPHPALADFPLANMPYMGVYRWGAANSGGGGAKAVVAFSNWLDKPAVWAEDFEPTERWANNIEGGSWQLPEWSKWKKDLAGRRLVLSVPLLPGGWDRSGAKGGAEKGVKVSLEAGARGEYNEHYKNLAANLVQNGLGDSVIRLGWEFNGGWYTWRGADNPKAWGQYFAQAVKSIRSVPGAEKLQICWNPASGWQQFPSEAAWPGDDYVDIVGLDLYDDSWAANTYPLTDEMTAEDKDARHKKVWENVLYGGDHGLKFWRDYAAKHKKLFAIPEWGTSKRQDKHGGLDNPYFVEQMHKFISDPANNVYFHVYFDVQAGDGHHQLSSGYKGNEVSEFPQAAARFMQLFGGPKAGQTTVALAPVTP